MRVKVNGTLIRQSSGTQSKVEAKKIYEQWAAEQRKQNPKKIQKLKCKPETLFAEYGLIQKSKWRKHQNPKKSQQDFECNVRLWLEILDKNIPLDNVNLTSKINDHKIKRKDHKIKNTNRVGVKDKSINNEIDFLRAAFKHCLLIDKYELCKEPIWSKLKYKIPESDEDKSISENDWGAIFHFAKPHVKNQMWFRQIEGLRKFNGTSLTTEMIDWDKMEINVVQKGDRKHVVPITDEIENLLKGNKLYDTETDKDHKARLKCLNLNKPGPVFLYKGKPFKDMRRAYKTAQKDAGLTKTYTQHQTRHTAGDWIGNSSDSMKFFGHTNIKTTRKYERSTDLRIRRESAKKIGKKVSLIVSLNQMRKNKALKNG